MRREDRAAISAVIKSIESFHDQPVHSRIRLIREAIRCTSFSNVTLRTRALLQVMPSWVWPRCASAVLASLRAYDFNARVARIAEELIVRGADPNTPIISCSLVGNTVLCAALYHAHRSRAKSNQERYLIFVGRLLKLGANPNQKHHLAFNLTRSPLCHILHTPYASPSRCDVLLRKLLEAGADPTVCCAVHEDVPLPTIHCVHHGECMGPCAALIVQFDHKSVLLAPWRAKCTKRSAWAAAAKAFIIPHITTTDQAEAVIPESWTRPVDRQRGAARCARMLLRRARCCGHRHCLHAAGVSECAPRRNRTGDEHAVYS